MMRRIDNQIYVCEHIEVMDSAKVEEGSVASKQTSNETNKQASNESNNKSKDNM